MPKQSCPQDDLPNFLYASAEGTRVLPITLRCPPGSNRSIKTYAVPLKSIRHALHQLKSDSPQHREAGIATLCARRRELSRALAHHRGQMATAEQLEKIRDYISTALDQAGVDKHTGIQLVPPAARPKPPGAGFSLSAFSRQ